MKLNKVVVKHVYIESIIVIYFVIMIYISIWISI